MRRCGLLLIGISLACEPIEGDDHPAFAGATFSTGSGQLDSTDSGAGDDDGELETSGSPGSSSSGDPSTPSTGDPTTSTTGDPGTSTTGFPDPSDTGDPGTSTTGFPDPPNTGGSDDGGACEPPDGLYGDCVNGTAEVCGDPSAGCLVDDVDAPSFGVCYRACNSDCECWAAPASGTAQPTCAALLEGGGGACVLACTEGETCPDGMSCSAEFGLCVYEGASAPPPPGGSDLPDTAHCAPVANWPAQWVELEEEVLLLTNQVRAQGASCGGQWYGPAMAVTMNPELRCSARLHSLDMATYDYFSHDNLQGQTPFDRIGQAGYDYSTAGENIAAGQSTAQDVLQAWLDSPGHCSILMHPNFEHLGVGFANDGSSSYSRYWTQNFGAM